jgi:hypothetical protein
MLRPRPGGPTTYRTMLVRTLRVTRRRGMGSLLALLSMPCIGTVIAMIASPDGLRPGPDTTIVLSIATTTAALTGAALLYGDVVAEQDTLLGYWRAGVSAAVMVTAKATVAACTCTVLAGAMLLLFQGWRDLPPEAYGTPACLAIFLAWLAVMIGSMGLGILISAVSPTLERAVTLNTILSVMQVALTGALFDLPPLLRWLPLPARLGFAAEASYLDLNRLRAPAGTNDPMWEHTASNYWTLLAMTALISVMSLAAASLTLRRRWRTRQTG